MAQDESIRPLHVEVLYSPCAGKLELVELKLPQGATVLHALRESRLLEQFPEIELTQQPVGVWGRLQALSHTLRDHDRVELYRGLKVDPKEARRQRYHLHQQRHQKHQPRKAAGKAKKTEAEITDGSQN